LSSMPNPHEWPRIIKGSPKEIFVCSVPMIFLFP
jgi:hypothetical protein